VGIAANPAQASEAENVDNVIAQNGRVSSISGFNPPAMTNNKGHLYLATPARQVEISLETDNIADVVIEWDDVIRFGQSRGSGAAGQTFATEERDLSDQRQILRKNPSESVASDGLVGIYEELEIRGFETDNVEPGDEITVEIKARQAGSEDEIGSFEELIEEVDSGNFNPDVTATADVEIAQGTIISANSEMTTDLATVSDAEQTIAFDIDQLRDETQSESSTGPAEGIIITYHLVDDDGLNLNLSDSNVTLSGAASNLDLEVVDGRQIPGVGMVLCEIAEGQNLEEDANLEEGDTVTVELNGLDASAVTEENSTVRVGLHERSEIDAIIEDSVTPDRGAYTEARIDFDIIEQSDESSLDGVAARFQDASDEAGIGGLLAGAGVIGGGGYLAYRSLTSDDIEESKHIKSDDDKRETSKERAEPSLEVSTYTELKIRDQLETTDSYQLTSAQLQERSQPVWVITPAVGDGKTIEGSQTKEFLNNIEPWTKMDNHPTLLEIYGHGTEPLPWLALEAGDHRSLADVTPESSLSKKLEYLTQACDGVHHVHRYGISYESFTPDSVLVTTDGLTKLRGVIDYLTPTESTAYAPPESTDEQTAESAAVYRLGSIGYEILTGQHPTETGEYIVKPSDVNPKLPKKIDSILLKALSTDPEDRYETVLHLRDELQEVNS